MYKAVGNSRYLGAKYQNVSSLRLGVVVIGSCQDLAVEEVGRGLIHALSCILETLC